MYILGEATRGLPSSGKGWYDYTGVDLAAKGAESEAELIQLLQYLNEKESQKRKS